MTLRILHYADIEHGYDDPTQIGRLAEHVNRLRDENTVVIGGGDNTGPSVLGLVTDGKQALDFFEAIEPDAEIVGNHEFDRHPDLVEELIASSPTKWVCANVYRGDNRFASEHGVIPATVVETADHRVGLVGVTKADTADIAPKAEPLTFTDSIDAARDAITELKESSVDYLVCISHRGDDTDLAEKLDFDVILGAHYHSVRNETVSGTLLTRPGSGGTRLVEVTLDAETTNAQIHDVSTGPIDEDVADSLRERIARAELDEVITTVETPLDRRAWLAETPLGNFVADAFRWQGETDVGLVNSEAVRDTGTPLQGDVTKADIISLSPFEEDLVVLELDGSELRQTIRRASGRDIEWADSDWWLGVFSNVSVTWNPRDETLVEATVADNPIDPDETYTLTTQRYNVEEQMLFPHLDEENQLETVGDMHETLIAYASSEGIRTTTDGRLERKRPQRP